MKSKMVTKRLVLAVWLVSCMAVLIACGKKEENSGLTAITPAGTQGDQKQAFLFFYHFSILSYVSPIS